MPGRALAKHALLGLASTAVALLAVELALRLATPPSFGQKPFPNIGWLRFDPVGGWRNVPDFRADSVEVAGRDYRTTLTINAHGFRGPPLVSRKPEGVVRIVCQGDSGTFGFWRTRSLAESDRFSLRVDSYALELRARLEDRSVEVLNAGVLGYTSSHGLRQLVLEVLPLDPDVVTVRFGYNDHTRAWSPAFRALEPADGLRRGLLYAFAGWRLLRLTLAAHQSVAWLHPAPRSLRWSEPDEFEGNLRRYAELSRERGFRLLFLDYPLAPHDGLAQIDRNALVMLAGAGSIQEVYRDHATYQALLRSVAAEEGVPVLESAPLLRSEHFSPADAVHPNLEGSRELALLLADRLADLGWLDPERAP